jgi:hypothetical protein
MQPMSFQKLPDAVKQATRLVTMANVIYINAMYFEGPDKITKSYKYVVDTGVLTSYTDWGTGQEYRLMGYYTMSLNLYVPRMRGE